MNKLLLLLMIATFGCVPQATSDTPSSNTPTNKVASRDSSESPAMQMDEESGLLAAEEERPTQTEVRTVSTPVYGIDSPYCENRNGRGSAGKEFVRKCRAYDHYSLWATGSADNVNYRIESDNPNDTFSVPLSPLKISPASEYVRGDEFISQLDDRIDWLLDENSKPYVIFVRVAYYRNEGSRVKPVRSQRKVAEYILVRGLVGFETLRFDEPTINTTYNPEENARMKALIYLEDSSQ